ncbi:hypothetical protein ACP70R_008374 [Stipagrostis hirtigluma subsp. patula]
MLQNLWGISVVIPATSGTIPLTMPTSSSYLPRSLATPPTTTMASPGPLSVRSRMLSTPSRSAEPTSKHSSCEDCVATAFHDAQHLCVSSRDTTVFYDTCLLRVSYWNFTNRIRLSNIIEDVINTMNTAEIPAPMLPGWDPNNATNITGIIKVLLQETSRAAANSRWKYANGRMDVSSTFPPLYSMAQCTPDMAPGECWVCLQSITDMAMEGFAGKQGGRILTLWCNLRYDTAQFYTDEYPTLIEAPAPAAVPAASSALPSLKHNRHMSRALVIVLVVSVLVSLSCLIVSFGFIRRHIKGSQDNSKINVKEDESLAWDLEGRSSEFTVYDISQILEATGNFSEENKLGQGGFGPVYKGRLPDGLEIAVKRLASHSGQGFTEFKNEIQLIAKLQHMNLVRLLGCCCQGEEKTLVYEYLPNKSLDFFIFDETRRGLLGWNKRLAIVEGIAQGLLYLHKHSRLRVIHRDLKTGNILLDGEMKPKISDFGLAKIFSTNDTEGNTKRIVGTYGYMAPEYASEGLFSTKSDVFSFGVLILEILSGKSFHGYGDFINLPGHAWQLWKDGLWRPLVDASLVTECHTPEIMRCINIALLCVQENAADRPNMSDVVAMLNSDSMTLPDPKHPAYFHVRVTTEGASLVLEPSSLNDVTVSALDGR